MGRLKDPKNKVAHRAKNFMCRLLRARHGMLGLRRDDAQHENNEDKDMHIQGNFEGVAISNELSQATLAKKAAGAKKVSGKTGKKNGGEIATASDLHKQRERIIYDATKILVPMWFGQSSVDKVMKRPRLEVESALCLLIYGSTLDAGRTTCMVSCQMTLRPSGFSRGEASTLVEEATVQLLALKLVRFTSKKQVESNEALADIVLTSKGKKLYDLVSKSMLSPMPKGHSLF